MNLRVIFVIVSIAVLLEIGESLSSRRRSSSSPSLSRRRRSPVPSASSRRRRLSPSPSFARRRRSPSIPTTTRRRRSSYGNSRRRRAAPNYRKKPVYKNTKMQVVTYESPVILSQTRYIRKSSSYPKYIAAGVAAGFITHYTLSRAPVYRGYYPMYGNYIHVPQNRGMRVREERQIIVNRYTNERCYQEKVKESSQETDGRIGSYEESASTKDIGNPASTWTAVTYENGYVRNTTGASDITLTDAMLDEEFNVTTVANYEKDIPGTYITGNCTKVITTTRASMVQVFDSNPYANNALVLTVTSFLVLFLAAVLSYKLT